MENYYKIQIQHPLDRFLINKTFKIGETCQKIFFMTNFFKNLLTTITKLIQRIAHNGRLNLNYLLMLGVRLVMKLSYASSPLFPFLLRA